MKTEEEIRQHFMQYKFKPNPNHFIIVDKWNNRTFKRHKHEIFDYISECIDEWYNTFNKWNWTKFDNGVAVIKK